MLYTNWLENTENDFITHEWYLINKLNEPEIRENFWIPDLKLFAMFETSKAGRKNM